MRRHQALRLFAGLLGTSAPPRIARAATTHVSIGTSGAVSDATVYIADAKGYFGDVDLDVEFVPFDVPAKMLVPIGQGALDVGGPAASAALYNLFSRGVDIRIVADKSTMAPGYGSAPLVVRKALLDSGRVKSVRDLRGMMMVYAAPGTSSEVTLAAALRTGGLTLKDVRTVTMGFAEQAAALQSGAVDAGIVNEPALSMEIAAGNATILLSSDDFYPNQETAVTIYSGAFAKTKSDAARRFMLAYLRAARFYHSALKGGRFAGSNAPEVISILRRYTALKDPKPYTIMTPSYVSPNGSLQLVNLRRDFNFYEQEGLINGPISLDRLVDTSFVDAAVEKLGRVAP